MSLKTLALIAILSTRIAYGQGQVVSYYQEFVGAEATIVRSIPIGGFILTDIRDATVSFGTLEVIQVTAGLENTRTAVLFDSANGRTAFSLGAGVTFSSGASLMVRSEDIGLHMVTISGYIPATSVPTGSGRIVPVLPGGSDLDSDCNGNSIPDEQEQDLDGDGLIDDCDPDIDGDGLANEADVCTTKRVGSGVSVDGRPLGDIDGDCDTDLEDHYLFQQGIGNERTYSPVGSWDVFFRDSIGATHYEGLHDLRSNETFSKESPSETGLFSFDGVTLEYAYADDLISISAKFASRDVMLGRIVRYGVDLPCTLFRR